jgi:signal transduction histidine kinase/response regulator RpfG family c-di-GMP phosphodiesterase
MRAGAKERVLLVDDEPEVLVALEDLLDDSFIVVKAETPEKALRLLETDPDIAVIITDQRMPTMSGAEFLSRVGDKSKALRILVTGYSDLSAVIRSVNEGRIFGYATKPWDPDDLHTKVDKAAEHFRLSRQLAHERELLREQTSILNAVLESVGDGVVVTDSDGKFLLFNQQAERLLGASHDQTSLGRWTDDCGVFLGDKGTRLPPDEDPLVRGMVERTETEIVLSNAAVNNATVAVTATPLLRDKKLAGSVALLRDVTERRQLEQRLLQAQKMEAIGQLAGGVAHDFNNLLAVIQGCAELVLQALPDGDPMQEDMDQLLSATRRATTLTRQLLAFGRRQVLQPRLLDLNTLARNMEKMLQRLLGDGLQLHMQLAPSLAMVKADEAQLEQIVLNLVVNARDAMPSGGSITIRTRNVRIDAPAADSELGFGPGDFVLLSVQDDGLGMSAETQRRIFEPFFTTKEVGKGTGLGLSTVHGIVQQSDGQIRIDSEIGRGTRFDVYLPGVPGAAQNSTKAATTPLLEPARTRTILLVDDDEAVRRVAARILRQQGYTVLEASRASDARALAAREGTKLDLLLADVIMPGTTGPALASELVQADGTLRVLYMSGYPSTAVTGGPAHAPAEYLAKPFTPRSLLERVRSVLGEESPIQAANQSS